jgi:SAM-dependent methyltransferase
MRAAVAWHDVECHAYTADLALWRALAAQADGPVLDVGAGTGRVALDLAAAGHEVVALDVDGELLDALRERAAAAALAVEVVEGDAEALPFADGAFALVLVPMQTVQLLRDRGAFLRGARRVLRPGGLLAIAIADELAAFGPGDGPLPDPDVLEADGWRYVSQPTAVWIGGERSRIERLRVAHGPDGSRTTERNLIELAVLSAPALADEGRGAGLRVVPGERIAPTPDHVGSAVVLFRA